MYIVRYISVYCQGEVEQDKEDSLLVWVGWCLGKRAEAEAAATPNSRGLDEVKKKTRLKGLIAPH